MEARAQTTEATATRLKLYEVGAELEAVVEELMENDGILTPELEERLAAWDAAFTEKAERVALYIQNLLGLAKAAKEESERLSQLADVRENAAKRLKGYLQAEMEATGQRTIETARCKMWIQKNGRPSIDWSLSEEEIPEAYRRVTVEPDKSLAYEVWRTGGKLPGGFVVDHGSHLRIR